MDASVCLSVSLSVSDRQFIQRLLDLVIAIIIIITVSYTHLTLPTIYSV